MKPTTRVARKPSGAARRAPPPSSPSDTQPAYEELLHFFNESADLLCIAGFDGMFKRLNPSWQSALGWTLEELRARPFLDFVHPEDRPATLAEMDKLATGATTITFENRYRCKEGSWIWLQWTASPLPGERKIYAVARDVSRQKHLEQEILETLDRERERVARELHDGLCQDLAAVAALSATLAQKLALVAAPESAAARKIGKLLRRFIRDARDLARGINPVHLEATGLRAALADFCQTTQARFKLICQFEGESRPTGLDPIRKIQLYRIAQEAVNNAIVHGRPKRIEVSLAFQNGQGTLAIRNNGAGMGKLVDGQRGIGFHTMLERTRLIGGTLELHRCSPRGTLVHCVFPMPPAEPGP